MASDVGDDLGLDDLVYVTLGIESTIKHDQVRPTLTVYPSPNHETATSPSVLLRNADVSMKLRSHYVRLRVRLRVRISLRVRTTITF